MNGRITEHIFYSFSPKLSAEAVQSVRKARSRFLAIPRLNPEGSGSGFLSEIPQPHHRIQTQTQRCGSFWSLTFVRLGLLATQKLFCIFERILDGPSVVVTFQNPGGGHRQIGRKKKIVSFFSGWISAYYKQYRLMRNPIPYYLTSINQSLYRFASLAKLYLLPIANIRSHLLRVGQTFALLARSASCFLSSFGRQIENLCVSLYSRNQMCVAHLLSSQSGVKTIRNQSKLPFRQPLMELVYHLRRQFYQGVAVLSVQSHVDRQSQRLAAPGRLNLQGQNHKIQSPGTDNAFLCRADGIPPITGTVDLSSTVMEQCIVQSNSNDACRTKEFDQYHCHNFPELVDIPAGIWKKTMVGIVSTPKAWIGKWKEARYRSSNGAQNPAGHQTRENLCTRHRENWKKLLNYIRPCRNNCMHIDLPVLIVYSIKTSAGRYVFVYKPLKSVA
jgi:hypothetical protein